MIFDSVLKKPENDATNPNIVLSRKSGLTPMVNHVASTGQCSLALPLGESR